MTAPQDELIQAPEGTEFDIVAYLVSDTTSLELRVAIRGLSALAPLGSDFDPTSICPDIVTLADDWRVMTRAEIAAYKKDNNDGE